MSMSDAAKGRSESIIQLTTALANFQAEMPDIRLDSTVRVTTKAGGTYNFKYATLANILKQLLPLLAKHGLSITQLFRDGNLVTILFHKSGELIESVIPIDLTTGSMQEIGSRISYLKRYSLLAIVVAIGDEDDDGNVADGNTFTKPPQTKQLPKAKSMPEETSTIETQISATVTIESIHKKTGKKKDGTPWILYLIAASGQIYSTFSITHAEEAKKAKESGSPVKIEYVQTEKGRNIESIKMVEIPLVEGCIQDPNACEHSQFTDMGRAYCGKDGPECKYQISEDTEGGPL